MGRLRHAGLGLATAAIYIAGAKMGLRLAFVAEQVTAVWPPTGIALSAVLLLGYRIWPFIFLGAFVANITTNTPLLTSLGIATGNTLEAVAGAFLLRRANFDPALSRFRDVFSLIFYGAMISTVISATIGAGSLYLTGIQPWSMFGALWFVWFLGDAMGDVVVAPLVLTLAASVSRRRLFARFAPEFLLLMALVTAIAVVTFGAQIPGWDYYPPAYAVFPCLIWAALRFGSAGTAITAAVISTVAVIGTVQGSGPFTSGDANENLISLQLFMFVAAVTGLIIAASQAERDTALSSAHDSEQRYRSLVMASSQVVWSTNGVGEVIEDLPTWRAFTGQTMEELMGRGWMKKLHPDDLAQVAQVWERSLATGTSHESEFRVQAADGTYRSVFARAVPLHGSGREVREWVGTLTDITERKNAEDKLREANQRKDEFLAMLAHELRNPLAPVRNGVEIIRASKDNPERIDWTCEIMERQVRHMSRLLDDLLDVARITRGQIQLLRQPTDLVRLVERSLESIRSVAEKKPVKLESRLVASPVPISADVTRLEQITVNLLTNALKFTPAGGTVSVSVDLDGSWGVLRIRDTGRGIAPELLPAIFDVFTQGDRSLARSEGGLGIGLSLAQRLVQMHSGSISAASEGPGRGSEFTVRLPTIPVEPAKPPAGAGRQPSTGQAMRILVVEDQPDSANTLAVMLRLMGHDVYLAADGPAAMAELERVHPAVVFLDIGLPGISGFEVAERIRAAHPRHAVKIIALTGYGGDSDRQRAAASGFDRHLIKPVSLESLEKLLGEFG